MERDITVGLPVAPENGAIPDGAEGRRHLRPCQKAAWPVDTPERGVLFGVMRGESAP
jgi:hypothetical protein